MMKTKFKLIVFFAIFASETLISQSNLSFFNGQQASNNIGLAWQSSSEMNMDYYAIERSLDGISFIELQIVSAIGNSSVPTIYTFDDDYLLSDTCYYYRLKETTVDGSFYYSMIIYVCFESSLGTNNELSEMTDIRIFPNPSSGSFTIEHKTNNHFDLQISNALGQTVYSKNKLLNIVKINSVVESGIYFVELTDENGSQKRKIVVK